MREKIHKNSLKLKRKNADIMEKFLQDLKSFDFNER